MVQESVNSFQAFMIIKMAPARQTDINHSFGERNNPCFGRSS